jgi:purine-nucleoside phosphorylase
MNKEVERINRIISFLQAHNFKGDTGIILGTGLGGLIDHMELESIIPYVEIPEFPVSTVESHPGKLMKGKIADHDVLVFQGRFHFYEGYSMNEVATPVRILPRLGVNRLLISNAAGAVNLSYKKGDLMLLDDHINLLPSNPLIGPNLASWGPRFPDMSAPYDADLNQLFKSKAEQLGIALHEGVYLAVSGPSLETRAEYRMMRNLGADVVGMSTVPEVLVANQMGIPVAAVSVVTDIGDPDNLKSVDLASIIAVAKKAEKKLSRLVIEVLADL